MRNQSIVIAGMAGTVLVSVVFMVGLIMMMANQSQPRTIGRGVTRPAVSVGGPAILVRRTDELLTDDPFDSIWDSIAPREVVLQAQQLAMPQLIESSVPVVRVSALTDGDQVLWRLSWDDATDDSSVDAGVFCDAAAIQFPLKENAPFLMGGVGMPVQIIQWKALWQKDIDVHFQDVLDLHPNYWTDLYWFASGEGPQRMPDAFEDPRARQYLIGYSAGNPVSRFDRVQPVQEFIAEGFGTLTAQTDSVTAGRGEWRDGEWAVVFRRPLLTSDSADYQFDASKLDVIGFAIWEGSAEEVGGRKQYALWTEFGIEQ
jgi:hypothetical protein